jgi:hypothetical protein
VNQKLFMGKKRSQFRTRRAKGLAVKGDDIRLIARKYIQNPEFRASNGWVRNFITRHNLSYRSSTHAIQKILDSYPSLISKLLEQIRSLRFKYEDQKEDGKSKVVVFNMDETPLEFDLAHKCTYDFCGNKQISVLRTNGAKSRCTIDLTISSTGDFLMPLIIFKTQNPLPSSLHSRFKGRAMIRSNKTGWMKARLMNEYILKIYDNTVYPDVTMKVLVLDQFAGHKSAEMLDLYCKLKMKVFFIPSGCTSLVQPLDTDINKPFKDRMRAKFNKWLADYGSNLQLNSTRKGRLKAPDYELITTWILQSIEDIPPSMVAHAFKHCGISFYLLLTLSYTY